MDILDPRHGSHPSQSIHDAAYPDDSPYRPSTAGSLPHASRSSVSIQQHTYSPHQPYGSFMPGPPSPNPNASWPASHQIDIPQGPPPPYELAQLSATSSPAQPAAIHSLSQASTLQAHPSPPGSFYHLPSPSPYRPADAAVETYKLGPTAKARQRRRRRIHICSVALGLTVLFIIALIVGVAMGVLKVKFKDDGKE